MIGETIVECRLCFPAAGVVIFTEPFSAQVHPAARENSAIISVITGKPTTGSLLRLMSSAMFRNNTPIVIAAMNGRQKVSGSGTLETSLIAVWPHEPENRTRRSRRRAAQCLSRVYPTLSRRGGASDAPVSWRFAPPDDTALDGDGRRDHVIPAPGYDGLQRDFHSTCRGSGSMAAPAIRGGTQRMFREADERREDAVQQRLIPRSTCTTLRFVMRKQLAERTGRRGVQVHPCHRR